MEQGNAFLVLNLVLLSSPPPRPPPGCHLSCELLTSLRSLAALRDFITVMPSSVAIASWDLWILLCFFFCLVAKERSSLCFLDGLGSRAPETNQVSGPSVWRPLVTVSFSVNERTS